MAEWLEDPGNQFLEGSMRMLVPRCKALRGGDLRGGSEVYYRMAVGCKREG